MLFLIPPTSLLSWVLGPPNPETTNFHFLPDTQFLVLPQTLRFHHSTDQIVYCFFQALRCHLFDLRCSSERLLPKHHPDGGQCDRVIGRINTGLPNSLPKESQHLVFTMAQMGCSGMNMLQNLPVLLICKYFLICKMMG